MGWKCIGCSHSSKAFFFLVFFSSTSCELHLRHSDSFQHRRSGRIVWCQFELCVCVLVEERKEQRVSCLLQAPPLVLFLSQLAQLNPPYCCRSSSSASSSMTWMSSEAEEGGGRLNVSACCCSCCCWRPRSQFFSSSSMICFHAVWFSVRCCIMLQNRRWRLFLGSANRNLNN